MVATSRPLRAAPAQDQLGPGDAARAALAAMIRGGPEAVRLARERGVDADSFVTDDLKRAWKYLNDRAAVGQPGTPGDVLRLCGVELPGDAADTEAYVDRLADISLATRTRAAILPGLDAIVEGSRSGGVREAVEGIQAGIAAALGRRTGPQERTRYTAEELLDADLRERRVIVPNLLLEGVTLLSAAPKTGKSFAVLALCIAAASGGRWLGHLPVARTGALYISFEDDWGSLRGRLEQLLDDAPVPDDLHLAIDWPTASEGGVEHLRTFLEEHPDVRLVVIDTFGFFRPPRRPNASQYDEDRAAVRTLKELARESGAAVVLVHHTRKMASENILDLVSGTNGLVGTADQSWIMQRETGAMDATLHVTGRGIEENTLALRRDRFLMTWSMIPEAAADLRLGSERRQIIEVLRDHRGAMSAEEVALATGRSANTIRRLLAAMANDGQIERPERGRYCAPPIKAINVSGEGDQGGDQRSTG